MDKNVGGGCDRKLEISITFFLAAEILWPCQQLGLQSQPKQMIFLFSFSWFSFCRILILSAIQKIFALNSRFCSQLLSQISKIKVDPYTAQCTGQRAEGAIDSLEIPRGMGCLFYALKSVVPFVKFNCKPVLNLKVIELNVSFRTLWKWKWDHPEIQIVKFILNWLKRAWFPMNWRGANVVGRLL